MDFDAMFVFGLVAEEHSRSLLDLWDDFRLRRDDQALLLSPQSPLATTTIAGSGLESYYDVTVLGILRKTSAGEKRMAAPVNRISSFIQKQYCWYFSRDAIGEANLASLPKIHQPSQGDI
jgi:hypothetical protein